MNITIIGAGGRMGRVLIRSIIETKNVKLIAALENKESQLIGEDVYILSGIKSRCEIKITDDPMQAFSYSDAVIDFTSPKSTLYYIDLVEKFHIPYIIGTTGFTQDEEKKIKERCFKNVIIKSGNMSFGINLLSELVKQAAKILYSKEFDIEILEMHHRKKIDSPSGTALLLAESISHAINIKNNEASKNIGFSSLRGGTIVGEHSVIFAGNGERIIISHTAEDRSIFARGAIYAAIWAQEKPYGLYSMLDVLNLNCS